MEAKFDPKAKVKQGQFSDAPDGKQPNREHTNIDFEKQVFGKIYGFHRSFCMLTKLGRGSFENPGLMLGLDKGGSCKGILFKLNKFFFSKNNLIIIFKTFI